MEKRYQVFVSSTYEDLQEERQAVMQALLELDCIPAGMELFPASSEEQWSLIRRVIDESDYYVLILAGRYGSCNEEGVGYTEMEYRYALETGKPVIAFLHKDRNSIPAGKTELDLEGRDKLEAFYALAKTKMVKFWTNPDELSLVVTASLSKLQKRFPAVGWVRADQAADQETYRVLAEREKEIRALKKKLEEFQAAQPAADIARLAQGDDPVDIAIVINWPAYGGGPKERIEAATTWDAVFCAVAPGLLRGAMFERTVRKWIARKLVWVPLGRLNSLLDKNMTALDYADAADVAQEDFEKIRVQFLALGLIRLGKGGDWVLTEKGERHIIQKLAVRKPEAETGAAKN